MRYRQARFLNRIKPKGCLAPSLQHRIDTVMSWVNKIIKSAPITAISQELVKFDTQLMQNPDIFGVEYQHGTLFGYSVKEYLLEKWEHKCAYCGKENVPLEIEHIHPRTHGGSNAISNLTLSCVPCNTKKDKQSIEIFLKGRPLVLEKILAQIRQPLKDAAAVNSTRKALARRLEETGLSVEFSNGGRTKFNRFQFSIPKTHALDAVCVGDIFSITNWNIPVLEIKCTGRGMYQRTLLDKYGFPRGYLMREKAVKGFQTGDIIKAIVIKGKNIGEHIGRVAVRAKGWFDITTRKGIVTGVNHKNCQLIFRNDGYGYYFQAREI